MKKIIYLILLLGCVQLVNAHPLDSVVVQINTDWKDKNHAAILSVINSRLTSDPNDAFALYLKYAYYMYADLSLPDASNAITTLHTNSLSLSDTSVANYLLVLKNQVINIPMSENIPFTQQEIDAIHDIFENSYPQIKVAYEIALKFE